MRIPLKRTRSALTGERQTLHVHVGKAAIDSCLGSGSETETPSPKPTGEPTEDPSGTATETSGPGGDSSDRGTAAAMDPVAPVPTATRRPADRLAVAQAARCRAPAAASWPSAWPFRCSAQAVMRRR